VTCVLFVRPPLVMVRTTIIELLEGEPEPDVRSPVAAAVAAVVAAHGLRDPDVRMTKVGPKLYVELEAVADPSLTIADQHRIREDLRVRLDVLPYDLWLNLELLPG
jgi:predicted Co/Zn/Cd cation transporter (cation efflux family)